jgi:hypothetical protein
MVLFRNLAVVVCVMGVGGSESETLLKRLGAIDDMAEEVTFLA